MTYDAVIVGAGPSGSYLGYLLAKAGYRIVIVDKEVFPRDKVCGGGLSQKTVDLVEFDISPVIQRKMMGAYLNYQNQDTVIKDLGERGGAAVLRSEFDQYILEQARSAGATFLSDCAFVDLQKSGDIVNVSTSKGEYQAKFVIGADGVFSKVRKTVFGNDLVTYMPALEALVYVSPDVIDRFEDRVLFDFGGMPRGYGWIFPKRDHLNVGVFSIFDTHNIQEDLKAFMGRYKVLRDCQNIKQIGFAIPLKNTKRIFQKENIWLVGDAAGFAESFYGEGIYFALKSAVIASKAFQESFDEPRSQRYSEYVHRELWDDLHYSELNAKMFFPMQKFGFYRMVRNEHVNYYFAELIAGRVGHKECFFKTLLTSPYWFFSKRFPPAEGATF